MMRRIKSWIQKLIYSAAVVCLMYSCGGIKRSSEGDKAGLIKIYIKGKDSLLCFAGPVEFHALTEGDLTMDYTYLKVRGHRNNVVCNFSVISKDANFRPDNIQVITDNGAQFSANLTLFFAEGYGRKKFHYRYSFETSDLNFQSWMLSQNPKLFIGNKNFTGARKFRKGANAIYRNILFDAF